MSRPNHEESGNATVDRQKQAETLLRDVIPLIHQDRYFETDGSRLVDRIKKFLEP